jgi:hypothetical protein
MKVCVGAAGSSPVAVLRPQRGRRQAMRDHGVLPEGPHQECREAPAGSARQGTKGICGAGGEVWEVRRVSMKERIKGWLVEEEILVEEVEDAGSGFRFLVMFPREHYMEVVQPLTRTDMVMVLSPTSVSDGHREIMERSRPEQRAEFIWALRFVMNTFPVDFEMDHPENILAKFTITDIIYEDGLSKDRLMASIRRVWKANLQVIWILQKEFGTPEPEKKEPGSEGIMYM